MNNELRIMNKGEKKEKNISSHNSCFIIHNSAAPRRRGFPGSRFWHFAKGAGQGPMPKFTTGFALMFAVLASSVLLSISVAIWNIALREVVLSSFGRESQIAFYSADSAAECAMYWDMKGAFATSTDTIIANLPTINCGALDISSNIISNDPANPHDALHATTEFSVTDGACARVVVTKNNPDGRLQVPTKIEAFGHNTCDASGPNLVERGFKINY